MLINAVQIRQIIAICFKLAQVSLHIVNFRTGALFSVSDECFEIFEEVSGPGLVSHLKLIMFLMANL